MTVRVIVTLHLPLEMGSAVRIMAKVEREFPDAQVAEPDGSVLRMQADDDWSLTNADRKRIARDRRRIARDRRS